MVGRLLLALLFGVAGALHFALPAAYVHIVPPVFPHPRALVLVSGAAEIAGAIGVLVPALRRFAGAGLIALLLAVFPANVYMLLRAPQLAAGIPTWLLWLRLPLQAVLIAWVWWCTLAGRTGRNG